MTTCTECQSPDARLIQVTVSHHEDGTPETTWASLCDGCRLLTVQEREVRHG